VFGYIFGLFLIFVIIWFIWYGTSLKRRQNASQHYGQRASHLMSATGNNAGHILPSTSTNHFSQYDYSAQSSLRRPLAQPKAANHRQMGNNGTLEESIQYSPNTLVGVRTNPGFNVKDEMSLYQHCSSVNAAHQYADDVSSSTSFVHTYQHRV
jgi:hypothetical protein